jgi:type I restriction enzyme S subunit
MKKIPEIRFPEFSGEWVEKRLGEIGDTYGGLNNKNKEHFNKGKDLYIPFMNIMINTIIDNNYLENVIIYPNENQNIVKKGDILFTTSSETPNEVGMCSVYLGDKKVYLNSFCFGFRLKNSNIDSLFLTYLLRYKRKLFYKIAQGATRYNLSKKHFNDLKIHIPPTLEEQQKIAEFLSSIDKKIKIEENKLNKLKEYKKGLLQKMFV